MSRALAISDSALGGEPDLLDVAIALLASARRLSLQHHKSVLIEASTILLDAQRADAPAAHSPVPRPRKARAAKPRTRGRKSVESLFREAKREVQKPMKSAPARFTVRPTESVNRVTIVFDKGHEAITYDGKSMELNARQAQVLYVLARAMPNPVDRKHIASKLWATPPQFWEQTVSNVVRECGRAVDGVGLEVKSVPGVGVLLRPREEST